MVRKAAVAGLFYPSDPASLKKSVEDFLKEGEAPLEDLPLALVVPHAGYPYSGAVAGLAWALVKDLAPDLVVLLGPSHRVAFEGFALPQSQTWETPLGELRVDRMAVQEIQGEHCLVREKPHLDEHSLEVQLPFLQLSLAGEPKILPILSSRPNPEDKEALIKDLLGLYHQRKGRVLFVCSTDLSHDYRYDEARRMDQALARALLALDRERLVELFRSREAEACGMTALEVIVQLADALKRTSSRIIKLTNSGEVIGDKDSRIVGYLSAVIS